VAVQALTLLAATSLGAQTLNSVAVNPTSLIGGLANSTGTVTLSSAAPAGGIVVTLTSSNTAAATVPSNVTVLQGATTATFTATTYTVTANQTVTVTATYASVNKTATLTVKPLLLSVSMNPTSVMGGLANSTGTVTLNAAAPAGGVTVTLSSNNAAASVPASVVVVAGVTTATFTATTTAVSANATVTVTASYAGASRTATLTVKPPISTLVMSPTSVVGGVANSTGTITLNAAAPAGGATVSLTSSNTSAATVPASVTVAAGTTTATFTATTLAVMANATVTITATCVGIAKTATLTVTPLLLSVAVSPATVVGGLANSTGTVTLNGAAPAGGAVVTLTSSNTSAATVPSSVTVAAGLTTATFTATTLTVTANATVTITAANGGVNKTASLTVQTMLASLALSQTSVIGAYGVTGTLTLNAAAPAGGTLVTLSSSVTTRATVSASVTIPTGSKVATFPITTLAVATSGSTTITAANAGTSKTAALTVSPTANPYLLTLDPSASVTSSATTGTVTLNGPAPAGGATVTLTSSNTSVATVPASVAVPVGATTATFTVTTLSTASTSTITAALNGVSKTAVQTVSATLAAYSVSLSPPSIVKTTGTSTGTVTLTGPAPTGGAVVTLTSSATATATVPASITVPAGSRSATFTVTAQSPAGTSNATISAVYGGATKTAVVTVTPSAVVLSVSLAPAPLPSGGTGTLTVTLDGPAPVGGAVVTLSTSDAVTLPVPASVTVAAGATSNTASVTAGTVGENVNAVVGATYGVVPVSGTFTVAAGLPSALSLNPTSVLGGATSTATLTLSGGAPTAGTVVNLSSSNTAVATVPATVTVSAGASSATFTVTSLVVASTSTATISASRLHMTQTAVLAVVPGAAALSSVSVSPASVVGGTSSTGTVTLTTSAPAGGIVVGLSSDKAAVVVPASVTVAAGASTATFTATTSAVASSTTATLTATYSGVTKTATLTVTPPAPGNVTLSPASVTGGAPSTATVTLTGPAPSGGAVATLTSSATSVATVPASVTVSAGSTSATFAVTSLPVSVNSSAVISALYNSVTKTATLTVLSPVPATVTLNPASVMGGSTSTGTVNLTGVAPTGGTVVSLTSSDTAVATVPASVTVPAGSTSAPFAIDALFVSSSSTTSISASVGASTQSATLTVTPCTLGTALPPALDPNDEVWVEDQVPSGANPYGTWLWDTTQRASGTQSHEEPVASGSHYHGFNSLWTSDFYLAPNDKLIAYVLLDPCNPPQEVLLQWDDGQLHDAFWGADLIPGGTLGVDKFALGQLPALGQWVRLEVPVSLLGLGGRTIYGMAFAIWDGRAWFDRSGKWVACPPQVAATPPPDSSETIWIDDQALPDATLDANWVWDSSQKASGTRSNTDTAAQGLHYHLMDNIWSSNLYVQSTDKLIAWVLLDPCDPPREIMLNWGGSSGGWEHRAYWGSDLIEWGVPGTPGRVFMGPLPPVGQWVRLEVPASFVDLEDDTVGGIYFAAYDGNAWWDRIGTARGCSLSAAPPPSSFPPDTVWMDDTTQADAVLTNWSWDSAQKASGAQSNTDPAVPGVHWHLADNLWSSNFQVGSTDNLVAYVLLDPCDPPQEIMLNWGGSAGGWEHRAFWGPDLINWGAAGTPGHVSMGALPVVGQWVRLEVPAASVDLAGRTVGGVYFVAYDGKAWWDRVGKGTSTGIPSIASLTISPSSVAGGATATGTATLTGPAPTGGQTVALSSSNPSAAAVPASILVSAGATTTTFSIVTATGSAGSTVLITGTSGSDSKAASLTITSTPPIVTGLSLSPASTLGGLTVSGTATLSLPAPSGGAVVTLTSSNTSVATVPDTITVPEGSSWASFTVTTAGVAATTTVTVTATCSGVGTSANLTLTPPVPVSVSAVTLSPASVAAGGLSSGTVSLTGVAPAGGASVTLQSSNTAAATVPASVTVPAGAASTTFTVTALAVAASASSTISATYGGGTATAVLTVAPAALSSVSLSPASVTGGTASSGTVTLTGAAPPGGALVALWSSNTNAATVPASVTVPWGATAATFSASTLTVLGSTTVTVTAAYASANASASLTVLPSGPCNFGTAAAPTLPASDVVWVEDQVPTSANAYGSWIWDPAQKASGSQSSTEPVTPGVHYHGFDSAWASNFYISLTENLVAYVLLDPCNPPREVLIQWDDGRLHDAFWGEDLIPGGTLGVDKFAMGPLPAAGQWVRLVVPSSLLGLEGRTVSGMTFALYDGRAWFDHVGKTPTCTPVTAQTPAADPAETIWVDDQVPAGSFSYGTWSWDAVQKASGTQSHVEPGGTGLRSHGFNNAWGSGFYVETTDKLIAWILIDPCDPPEEVLLQWTGTTEGYRRAFWGLDVIPWGTLGTDRFNMGPLPSTGVWTRLEVPASTLGFGSTIVGEISFVLSGGHAWWDRVGKLATCLPSAVAAPAADAAETIWVDDQVPPGTSPYGTWTWDTTQKAGGTQSHTDTPTDGLHFHGFNNAFVNNFYVAATDSVVAWVLIDPCDPPKEILLRWNGGSSVKQVFWGDDLIAWGTLGLDRFSMGALPPVGQWVRLSVPASTLAFGSTTIGDITFALYDGHAWWDRVGKLSTCTASVAAAPSPLPPDTVWIEDAIPTSGAASGTWIWDTTEKASGTQSHTEPGAVGFHQHYVDNAFSTPLTLASGDNLVCYVLIDPCDPPQEVMLQWKGDDGTWEHRAFWGLDLIAQGTAGTASRLGMGALPAAGAWARLELPASSVGLAGHSVGGMAFSLDGGHAWFDRAGKALTAGSAALYSVTLNPTSVVGGDPSTGTVTLTGAAPTGGISVTLSSSNTSVATVPASVTVLSGSTSATFTVTSLAVASSTQVTISGVQAGSTLSAALTVLPPPVLTSMRLAPNIVDPTRTATGTVLLSGPARAAGLSVALSSANPALVTVPASVTVPGGASSATFSATPVGNGASTTISATYSGVTKSDWIAVTVPNDLSLVWLSPSSLVGGGPATVGVVMIVPTLTGKTITLTSSSPSVVPLPASVTIAPYTSGASVTIATAAVASTTPVTITATNGSTVKTAVLSVTPAPALTSLALSPASVPLYNPSTGTVTLNAPAPAGGATVALSSPTPSLLASLPASVVIPAGMRFATFALQAGNVSSPTDVTVNAAYAGATVPATLHITPAVAPLSVTIAPALLLGGTSASGTVALNGALATTVTVSLVSSQPGVLAVPASVSVFARQATSLPFTVTTAAVTQPTNVTVTATYGGSTATATVRVTPDPAVRAVTAIASLVAGAIESASVVLDGPAGPNGEVVTLESSDPSVASVPASVTVPAGATSATFAITAGAVSQTGLARLTASGGGEMSTVDVTVTPTPVVTSLSLSWSSVAGGGTLVPAGTITLNGAAPSGGVTVSLSSDTPAAASVPATVTIPAGASQATFAVTTSPVASDTSVVIAASGSGSTAAVALTVRRPRVQSLAIAPAIVLGGEQSTATVTLDGPALAGGTRVNLAYLSPTDIDIGIPNEVAPYGWLLINEGQSQATFPIDTFPLETVICSNYVDLTASTGPDDATTARIIVLELSVAAIQVSPSRIVGGASATVTVTLNGTPPSGPVTVPLTSSNAAIVSVPSSVVMAGISITFNVGTSAVSADTPVTLTATYGFGASYTPISRSVVLTVTPGTALSSLTLTPSTVVGGASSTGKVTLNAGAPAGGAVVTLSSNSPKATVPASVTVPAGLDNATFTVSASAVSSTTPAAITGTYGVSQQAVLSITAAPAVSAVTVSPASVAGGTAASGTVTLNAAAPSGGVVVTLSSSNTSAATVPPSVTVAQGQVSASFTVTTLTVGADAGVTITATGGGSSATAPLTVRAPSPQLDGVAPGAALPGDATPVVYGSNFASNTTIQMSGPVYSLTNTTTALCTVGGNCPTLAPPSAVNGTLNSIGFSLPSGLATGYYWVQAKSATGALSGGAYVRVDAALKTRPVVAPTQHNNAPGILSGQTWVGTFAANNDPANTYGDYNDDQRHARPRRRDEAVGAPGRARSADRSHRAGRPRLREPEGHRPSAGQRPERHALERGPPADGRLLPARRDVEGLRRLSPDLLLRLGRGCARRPALDRVRRQRQHGARQHLGLAAGGDARPAGLPDLGCDRSVRDGQRPRRSRDDHVPARHLGLHEHRRRRGRLGPPDGGRQGAAYGQLLEHAARLLHDPEQHRAGRGAHPSLRARRLCSHPRRVRRRGRLAHDGAGQVRAAPNLGPLSAHPARRQGQRLPGGPCRRGGACPRPGLPRCPPAPAIPDSLSRIHLLLLRRPIHHRRRQLGRHEPSVHRDPDRRDALDRPVSAERPRGRPGHPRPSDREDHSDEDRHQGQGRRHAAACRPGQPRPGRSKPRHAHPRSRRQPHPVLHSLVPLARAGRPGQHYRVERGVRVHARNLRSLRRRRPGQPEPLGPEARVGDCGGPRPCYLHRGQHGSEPAAALLLQGQAGARKAGSFLCVGSAATERNSRADLDVLGGQRKGFGSRGQRPHRQRCGCDGRQPLLPDGHSRERDVRLRWVTAASGTGPDDLPLCFRSDQRRNVDRRRGRPERIRLADHVERQSRDAVRTLLLGADSELSGRSGLVCGFGLQAAQLSVRPRHVQLRHRRRRLGLPRQSARSLRSKTALDGFTRRFR
jgi:hypothetical protein